MQNVNNETNVPTTSKQPRTDSKTFFRVPIYKRLRVK